MNYLAHAYLSFGNPALVTGNLISDFVKGRKKFDYPIEIQQGIALHRAIDDFTDFHEGIKSAKEIFRPHYRLYSGAFVDVVYDHFLANDPGQFDSESDLAAFTATTYQAIHAHFPVLPTALHAMFNKMKEQDWLFNYRFPIGMERSFNGLVYRSKYMDESATAYHLFLQHYEVLKESYHAFFPHLHAFAKNYILENNFK
jgi:acyl carrier protein phosphodiesterase